MVSDETVRAGAGAVAETAKATGKAIEAATGFGGWVKQTIGTIPEDLLGIAGGDWLHQQRQRNLARMMAKTEEVRARIGAGVLHEPSVSVVLPLLTAAANEARPELQDLWAALLASALQPDGGTRVRRAFFDTLSRLEPSDAITLAALYGLADQERRLSDEARKQSEVKSGVTGLSASVARQALEREGILVWDNDFSKPRDTMSVPVLSKSWFISAYGMEFWKACNPSA